MGFESLRSLMEKLAVIVVGLSQDQAAMITRPLIDIPEAVLEATLDGDHRPGLGAPDQQHRLLQLMRLDPRPGLRRTVADACAGYWDSPLKVAPLLAELARDSDNTVREAAVRSMAVLLKHTAPLEMPILLTEWATSTHEKVRLALAEALSYVPLGFGVPSVRTLLASDPSPAVCQAISLPTRT
jgi:hypothetical protein